MSKPIEFKTYKTETFYATLTFYQSEGTFFLEINDRGNHSVMQVESHATLREIAAACAQAAEALEASQLVTFGDLAVGEWFRRGHVRMCKMQSNHAFVPSVAECVLVRNAEAVTRVTAEFKDVK